MKNYKTTMFSQSPISSSGENTIDWRIDNADENPVVRYVDCSITMKATELITLLIQIRINNETAEMRSRFLAVPHVNQTSMMGVESFLITFVPDIKNIIKDIVEFFKVIHAIDPLPPAFINEIKEKIPLIDLTSLLCLDEIENKMLSGKHDEALKIAMEQTNKGNDEALLFLVNLYTDEQGSVSSDQLNNLITILEAFPQSHKDFKKAQETLHHLRCDDSITQDRKNLENKFCNSLNAGDNGLASRYFDELCGGSGLDRTLNDINADTHTLLQLANEINKMKIQLTQLQKENKELRDYKASNETSKAAESRRKASHSDDNSNNNRLGWMK